MKKKPHAFAGMGFLIYTSFFTAAFPITALPITGALAAAFPVTALPITGALAAAFPAAAGSAVSSERN